MLISRLSLIILSLVFSQWLFAQSIGPVVDSQAQKAAACAYNHDNIDKATNFEINLSRHLGSLGFFIEQESDSKRKKPIRKGSRGKGIQ